MNTVVLKQEYEKPMISVGGAQPDSPILIAVVGIYLYVASTTIVVVTLAATVFAALWVKSPEPM